MADYHLDHVLIAVRDLNKAAPTFIHNLGFTLTPEGVHPGRGTHNRLIVFGAEYLELIAIRDPSEAVSRPTMSSFLKSREGVYMFALGADDIARATSSLREREVPVGDPQQGSRQGTAVAPGYTWQAAAISADATPGSETFVIQHHQTMEQRYHTASFNPSEHHNGAMGVYSLALAVRDAEAASARWSHAFGLKRTALEDIPSRGVRRARIELGRCYLDYLSPLRDGPLTAFLNDYGEAPYMLTVKVEKLSHAAALLAESGVPHHDAVTDSEGSSVVVDPHLTHGVRLRLIETYS